MVELPCGTPGTVYTSEFEADDELCLRICLPRKLFAGLTEDQWPIFEEKLHQGVLGPVEWLYALTWDSHLAFEEVDGRRLPSTYAELFTVP